MVVWGSGLLFPIVQGMLPRQPILTQNLRKGFIRHAGVPKQIGKLWCYGRDDQAT